MLRLDLRDTKAAIEEHEMGQRAGLRASDADREQIAERLRQATAEGRLLAHELEQRLATALRARTFGELDAVVADLPGKRVSSGHQSDVMALAKPALALAILIPIVVVAAVFVITGMLAMWALWALAGWWFFGHRRGTYYSRRGGSRGIGAGAGACARRGQTRPGFWL